MFHNTTSLPILLLVFFSIALKIQMLLLFAWFSQFCSARGAFLFPEPLCRTPMITAEVEHCHAFSLWWFRNFSGHVLLSTEISFFFSIASYSLIYTKIEVFLRILYGNTCSSDLYCCNTTKACIAITIVVQAFLMLRKKLQALSFLCATIA